MKFGESADPAWAVEPHSYPDPTYSMGLNQDSANLANFLSRPVLLHTETIAVSENLYRHAFRPWQSFFSDPVIQRKIHNFAYIKCKLKVKFVINASPFHYSLIMASYRPLADTNTAGHFIDINTTRTAVRESQMPRVFLEASSSSGGELTLPFVWPQNALRIASINDFRNMGEIVIQTLTPLRVATASNTSVTISVFAWAEDVELSMSTFAAPFTPQSSKPRKEKTKRKTKPVVQSKDEYDQNNGPVSGPANVLANIARGLEQAPIIGPFARATTIGASAIAGIASIFGFSRPVTTNEIMPYRNFVSGGTANTSGVDPIEKISMDPKQELTVDPRTVGLDGTDQMTINTIACRESFLTTFNWSESQAPGTRIFSLSVEPGLVRTNSGNSYPTALAFAAAPFEFWSGSIVLRFKIVCTKYHKGRIVISYDPKSSGIGVDPAATYSTSFSEVVDITESEDVIIDIPWSQETPYLESAVDFFTERYSDTNALFPSTVNNGTIAVSVLNELSSSNDTSPIQIAVFVKGGDDISFRCPHENKINTIVPYNHHTAQSSPIRREVPLLESFSYPETIGVYEIKEDEQFVAQSSEVRCIVHGCPEAYHDDIDHVMFGDPVHSFRSLVKRYNYLGSATRSIDASASEGVEWGAQLTQFPMFRGPDPVGLTVIPTGRYNYVNTTLLTYLSPAYVGRRGGIKWKYIMRDSYAGLAQVLLKYEQSNLKFSYVNKYSGVDDSDYTRSVSLLNPSALAGYSLTHQDTQQGLMYEVPFYSNVRFAPAAAPYGDDTDARVERVMHRSAFNISPQVISTTSKNYFVADLHVAAGEDFSFFWFLAAPILRNEVFPPAVAPPP
ncbi:hypothetical protein 2 [Wenzhou picorna-like virus 14]|uniref:hypothetical protein 2 n=1 Tax=Wenzhou picorna-like virus 14 TaxID=1923598 RepID=UPI00090C946E|nr:hypothetical protein 2 [Wenzhou picorna-like virus 14]APG78594.1 hypothetical protein 2 [Wenzhou picorna-like virus 14]